MLPRSHFYPRKFVSTRVSLNIFIFFFFVKYFYPLCWISDARFPWTETNENIWSQIIVTVNIRRTRQGSGCLGGHLCQ